MPAQRGVNGSLFFASALYARSALRWASLAGDFYARNAFQRISARGVPAFSSQLTSPTSSQPRRQHAKLLAPLRLRHVLAVRHRQNRQGPVGPAPAEERINDRPLLPTSRLHCCSSAMRAKLTGKVAALCEGARSAQLLGVPARVCVCGKKKTPHEQISQLQ